MLTQAYTAIEQFQSKISNVKTFLELKRVFRRSEADLIIEIGSSTFWQMEWNPTKKTVSGILEVKILPKILIGDEAFEAKVPLTFRFEDPKELAIRNLQDRLVDPIKKVIEAAIR